MTVRYEKKKNDKKITMKKTAIILSVFVLITSSCVQTTKKQAETANVCQKDTLIKLSETYGILFRKYDKELELWYEPRIVDFISKDTAVIQNFTYENGSELDIRVSPNKKYAVIDNIIKGYVETSTSRELYENYKCVLIDIDNAILLNSWQSDCGGEWDKNNNWISGGEIIFPNTEENNETFTYFDGFGDDHLWYKVIENKDNLTANDSIYTSNIRLGEKLSVGKVYTDNFEYLAYNGDGDYFLINVIKNGKVSVLVAFGDALDIFEGLQLKKGDLLEIRWKIDFDTPAGDDTIYFVIKSIEGITKINTK